MQMNTTLSAYRPTIAEINLAAFHENVKHFKKLAGNCLLMAVVKTNAYGHGVVPIGKEAVRAGADRLGVSTVEEGVLLRENGISLPIHLLSAAPPEQAADIAAYQLIAQVSSVRFARALSMAAEQQRKTVPVHLKIDSGLHRFGVAPSEALDFCRTCFQLPGLYWEGIYTHFSKVDEGDQETTERQFAIFMNTVEKLLEQGFTFPIRHTGGSSIALERRDMYLDMIRPGIALFGYPPAPRQIDMAPLRAVMVLKSEISQIHELPSNSPVGYGGEYVTSRPAKIAVIPIGMGDGYHKSLTETGKMLVGGKRVPIAGTVSLDQTMIDVTEVPKAAAGEEVILLGRQKDAIITARDIAGWMSSIVDEVLAGLTERVSRVYVYHSSDSSPNA